MKRLLYAATAIAGVALATTPAHAVLQLSANINGTIISCADQAACDTNPLVGQLQIANQTVAGVEFLGSAQTQVIGPTNSLDTSSFQIINDNNHSVNIQVAVSGTSFTGPVAAFSASGSGTFENAVGSSVSETFFASATNAQGAATPTDLPGALLATFSKTAATNPDSFSDNASGAFAAAGLYSMSEGTTGVLTAHGSLVGRSQSIVTQQAVPEPASVGLLGVGLLGVGFVARRKRSV
jgi:hypothetical protein